MNGASWGAGYYLFHLWVVKWTVQVLMDVLTFLHIFCLAFNPLVSSDFIIILQMIVLLSIHATMVDYVWMVWTPLPVLAQHNTQVQLVYNWLVSLAVMFSWNFYPLSCALNVYNYFQQATNLRLQIIWPWILNAGIFFEICAMADSHGELLHLQQEA